MRVCSSVVSLGTFIFLGAEKYLCVNVISASWEVVP